MTKGRYESRPEVNSSPLHASHSIFPSHPRFRQHASPVLTSNLDNFDFSSLGYTLPVANTLIHAHARTHITHLQPATSQLTPHQPLITKSAINTCPHTYPPTHPPPKTQNLPPKNSPPLHYIKGCPSPPLVSFPYFSPQR